jgi:hypothetical protein
MADSPDPRPRLRGQFSLPLLARAAVYHAQGLRADVTAEVVATGLPSGVVQGVAAGAWWAVHETAPPLDDHNPAFADWAATRVSSLGVPYRSARAVLSESLAAHVVAPVAGTALPIGAPLVRFTAPAHQLMVRRESIERFLSVGFGSASRAAALQAAAGTRPIVDAATVGHPDPTMSTFLAWCGRVGGFTGTTHVGAGWAREVPVVGVPSLDAPLTEVGDAIVDATDLHQSVASLVRRVEGSSTEIKRVSLDRPLSDDVELNRHFLLRRALDRHGLRKVRICARLPPTPTAVARVARANAPVDILVFWEPWWGTATVDWKSTVDTPECTALSHYQLQRAEDRVRTAPWTDEGLLQTLCGPTQSLSATPPALPRSSPLREAVHPTLFKAATSNEE